MIQNEELIKDVSVARESFKEASLRGIGITPEAAGINSMILSAYNYAEDANLSYIDLHGAIWDKEIPEFVEALKKYGIKKITISSTYSGLTNVLWKFKDYGFEVTGMEKVNAPASVHNSQIPALVLEEK